MNKITDIVIKREKNFKEFFPELLTEAGEVSRDINAFKHQTSIKLIEGIIKMVDKVASVNESNGRFNACEEIREELLNSLKSMLFLDAKVTKFDRKVASHIIHELQGNYGIKKH